MLMLLVTFLPQYTFLIISVQSTYCILAVNTIRTNVASLISQLMKHATLSSHPKTICLHINNRIVYRRNNTVCLQQDALLKNGSSDPDWPQKGHQAIKNAATKNSVWLIQDKYYYIKLRHSLECMYNSTCLKQRKPVELSVLLSIPISL